MVVGLNARFKGNADEEQEAVDSESDSWYTTARHAAIIP